MPAAQQEIVPPDQRRRPPCRPGEHREQRHQRPVQRDIVVGIADGRGHSDDFAGARAFRFGDCRSDLVAVGVGELRHHEPDAPPPPNEPPPKPPKLPPPPPKPPPPIPPPPPRPPPPHPREPRLSEFNAHSDTHGLMPPERVR